MAKDVAQNDKKPQNYRHRLTTDEKKVQFFILKFRPGQNNQRRDCLLEFETWNFIHTAKKRASCNKSVDILQQLVPTS